MPNELHEDRTDGIFIPWAKLLEQMDGKLDAIHTELRSIHDAKLDRAVFDAFNKTYTERHDQLTARVAEAEKPDPVVAELVVDKNKRDAVQANTRYWLAGGGLVGLLVLVNLSINMLRLAGHL